MSSTRTKIILLSSSVAVVAAGVYYYYKTHKTEKKEIEKVVTEMQIPNETKMETKLPGKVSLETATQVFQLIRMQLESASTALLMMKQQMLMQGGDETQVNNAAKTQFVELLKQITVETYRQYNVTESDMIEATKQYEDDKVFNHLQIGIKNMYATLAGGTLETVPIPDILTKEKLLELFNLQADISRELFTTILGQEAKKRGVTVKQLQTDIQNNPESAGFAEQLPLLMSQKQSELLQKNGLTSVEFESAVSKYSADPSFQVELQAIFQRTQEMYLLSVL